MSLLRLLLPLLPTLLRVLPEARQVTHYVGRRLVLRSALLLIPVLLLLVAAGFAIAAVYLTLAARVSPPAAAGLVALGLALLAGIEALVVIALDRMAERRREQSARAMRDELLAPLHQVERQIGARPLSSVLVAAVVGAVVASLQGRR